MREASEDVASSVGKFENSKKIIFDFTKRFFFPFSIGTSLVLKKVTMPFLNLRLETFVVAWDSAVYKRSRQLHFAVSIRSRVESIFAVDANTRKKSLIPSWHLHVKHITSQLILKPLGNRDHVALLWSLWGIQMKYPMKLERNVFLFSSLIWFLVFEKSMI